MHGSTPGAGQWPTTPIVAPCLDTVALRLGWKCSIAETVAHVHSMRCTVLKRWAPMTTPAQMYLCEVVLLSVGALALKAVRKVVVALPPR